MTDMSRSTIYVLMPKGLFPKPIRISKRGVRWFEDEILEWMESRERAGSAR